MKIKFLKYERNVWDIVCVCVCTVLPLIYIIDLKRYAAYGPEYGTIRRSNEQNAKNGKVLPGVERKSI